MKPYYIIILLAALVACDTPDQNGDLEAKKKELDTYQKELVTLQGKINQLEKEISAADPAFAKQMSKAVLVSSFTAEKKQFEHTVEVRGAVQSKKNILINAQSAGEIEKVHVREGQVVAKGQVLISINADIIRNNIAELKTSLELANSVYEKQAKLWEQKIGTELQYLQAKNNKESLEHKLAAANAQLDQAIVRAPFSGTIDELPAREGEVTYPGNPLVRVVSREDMYINADVSERFIGKFKAGDVVSVYIPATDKRVTSRITSVGQVINPENRTFVVEVSLPVIEGSVKPNQVVVLALRDYVSESAWSVPTRIIQRDEKGQFIYIIEKREEKLLARKLYITTGITSNNLTEVVEGLEGNERIVDEGFRDLTEGVEVEIASEESASVVKK